ncbi:MAG: hypothetical protein ACLFWD_06465 [Anaerolineales bacterium]
MQRSKIQPIAIYILERHPLEQGGQASSFRWLDSSGDLHQEIAKLIGPHDSDQVTLLIDPSPGGLAWDQLLTALMKEQLRMVITHLAPLSVTQRQQLIALCAQTGAQLITPADAGRNREGEVLF